VEEWTASDWQCRLGTSLAIVASVSLVNQRDALALRHERSGCGPKRLVRALTVIDVTDPR
jgi:hypothetical protein